MSMHLVWIVRRGSQWRTLGQLHDVPQGAARLGIDFTRSGKGGVAFLRRQA
ncbi:MAG: hypothetical protein ABGX04_19660 [Myxococcales bacterium]